MLVASSVGVVDLVGRSPAGVVLHQPATAFGDLLAHPHGSARALERPVEELLKMGALHDRAEDPPPLVRLWIPLDHQSPRIACRLLVRGHRLVGTERRLQGFKSSARLPTGVRSPSSASSGSAGFFTKSATSLTGTQLIARTTSLS